MEAKGRRAPGLSEDCCSGGLGQHHGQRGGGVDHVAGGHAGHGLRDTVPVAVVGVGGRTGPIAGADQAVLGVVGVGLEAIACQVAVGVVSIRHVIRVATGAVSAPIPAGYPGRSGIPLRPGIHVSPPTFVQPLLRSASAYVWQTW
jgi:hypothetical protein